jgi:flagellar biosynthetic protein FliP
MVLAMFAGMLVLGARRDVLGLTVAFDERPGAHYLLMATDMAIGMAAWMRLRRHGWACTGEMCAAMYIPAVLVPLVWADVVSAMTFMTAAHVLMMAAMLAVLLRRRHEYAH